MGDRYISFKEAKKSCKDLLSSTYTDPAWINEGTAVERRTQNLRPTKRGRMENSGQLVFTQGVHDVATEKLNSDAITQVALPMGLIRRQRLGAYQYIDHRQRPLRVARGRLSAIFATEAFLKSLPSTSEAFRSPIFMDMVFMSNYSSDPLSEQGVRFWLNYIMQGMKSVPQEDPCWEKYFWPKSNEGFSEYASWRQFPLVPAEYQERTETYFRNCDSFMRHFVVIDEMPSQFVVDYSSTGYEGHGDEEHRGQVKSFSELREKFYEELRHSIKTITLTDDAIQQSYVVIQQWERTYLEQLRSEYHKFYLTGQLGRSRKVQNYTKECASVVARKLEQLSR